MTLFRASVPGKPNKHGAKAVRVDGRASEDQEAIAFVDGFHRQWPAYVNSLIHISNEGGITLQPHQRFAHAAKRKKMGLVPGTSDYFLAAPIWDYEVCAPGMWLEIKAEGGSLKSEQAAFLVQRAKDGYAAVAAWTALGALYACVHYFETGVRFPSGVQVFRPHDFGPLSEFTLTGTRRKRG